MGRLIGVFGTAGLGREVMSLMRRQQVGCTNGDMHVFVAPVAMPPIHGVTVMEEETFLNLNQLRAFVVAIANGEIRRSVFARAIDSGASPLQVRATSAELCDTVQLGTGALLCAHSSITADTRVGIGFHLNISSYLAHDCVIGDFVTFGPHVVCAGNVVVEDGAYLGAGALIRQGKPGHPIVIGAGATIGMGAVVTKSVPAGSIVVGNPARPLERASFDA